MKASKHEYDNRFKDPEVQYKEATITENITVGPFSRPHR